MKNDTENRFTGLPIAVEKLENGSWKLLRDTSYRTKKEEISTARSGFEFDFASIPLPFRIFYSPSGDGYGEASLWHDWLYCHRKIGGRTIRRKEADELFYEIMKYLKVNRARRYLMYRAVRMFGWIPWGRRKPEDVIP